MARQTDSTSVPETTKAAAGSGGLSAGTLFGVQIRIDWSLLIVFTLVLFNLGAGIFPRWHPNWSTGTIWGVAFAAAVLFFVSVLAHEMSHALVARAVGIPVRRITLFLFGGMAHMEREPHSPKSEFLMAVVGPITSIAIGFGALVLAGALAGGAANMDVENTDPEAFRQMMTQVGPLATLLLWLGPINVFLGVFNIVPGFPLDGGRVLRSVLWWATGDLLKATRWAAGAGRAVAWGLIGLGVVTLLGGGLGGLWLMLIGWFLNNAARLSYEQLSARQALHEVPIANVMYTDLARVAPDLPLDRFVQEHLMASEQGTFAVESDGALLGLVSIDDVRKVAQERWAAMRVADIMTPREQLTTLPPDADAERALEALGVRDVQEIPVVDGAQLRGIVRRRDLARWLSFHGHGQGLRV